MTKAEIIFQKELSQIHNPEIKQFVITCFDKLCPDYFWTCPCSTSGKYHPQVSLGVGGLVRHTKLAVWWGVELLRALSKSPELKDIATLQDEVIATLLMHDMIKNGKGLNAKGYPLDRGVTGTHGVTLANRIGDENFTVPEEIESSCYRILTGIACHMGIWTTDPEYRPNCDTLDYTHRAFAQLIHLADYCASRKVDEIYRKLENDFEDQVDLELAKVALKRNDFVPLEEIIAELNLNKEKTNDTTKIPITKKETSPCPGVRETESCQTTTEVDSK